MDKTKQQNYENADGESCQVEQIVSSALKLWKYIEKLGENGVDIRCAGKQWMIGDNWNEITEGIGNNLQEAVENLPKHTCMCGSQSESAPCGRL